MGLIKYRDINYGGGGGSNVTPNPSETATANLEKIKIDSTTYAIKDTNAIHESDIGVAGGVAELDSNGKVPSSQLPTIPAAQVNSDWNASSGVAEILNKPVSLPASDVYAWAKESTKPTYTASEVGAVATTNVGVANGVASLDSNGKVPSAQLPSFVDDVVEGYYDNTTDRFYEESTFETVIPPVDGKSWVDVTANKSYRWTGSVYVRVDEGVQLGETSSTAYRGDRGKTAYDHSQSDHSAVAPAFSEASTRANILSGESFATLFGKIKKFFSDLKAVAFSGSYNDLSDKPTIPVATSTLSKTDNSHCPTSQAVFDLLEPIDETSYANLTEAQKNNGKAYFRYAAQNIIRPIQDDGTATDLTNGNLPTGQTIKSYLNSNLVPNTTRRLFLGSIAGTAADAKTILTNAFNAINVYDAVVTGNFGNAGSWLFIGYKYTGGQYGMLIATKYSTANAIYTLHVIDGTVYASSIRGTAL